MQFYKSEQELKKASKRLQELGAAKYYIDVFTIGVFICDNFMSILLSIFYNLLFLSKRKYYFQKIREPIKMSIDVFC